MDIRTSSTNEIRTATLVVVVLSILILGGTTMRALVWFRIRTGIYDHDGSDDNNVCTCRND
jgi:hypothetical protein